MEHPVSSFDRPIGRSGNYDDYADHGSQHFCLVRAPALVGVNLGSDEMKWGSPYFDCGMGLVTGTGFLGRLGFGGFVGVSLVLLFRGGGGSGGGNASAVVLKI